MEVTKYRCKNGFQWSNGKWPYLEMECLNKKLAPNTLPECVRKHQTNLIIALQWESVARLIMADLERARCSQVLPGTARNSDEKTLHVLYFGKAGALRT